MDKPMCRGIVYAAGLAFLLLGGVALAQETVRVRGTLERVEGDVHAVKTLDGSILIAEGHRSSDLQPNSTMTNATPEQIAVTADGHSLTLKYREGKNGSLFRRAR
jgi:hypothetical protein